MNRKEIRQAKRLLLKEFYVERFGTMFMSSGGQCLAAYWYDGYQTLFYSFGSVQGYITQRKEVEQHDTQKAETQT